MSGTPVFRSGNSSAGVETVAFHGLRCVVVRLQALRHLRRDLAPRCQFRVDEIIRVIKSGRFAEEQVFDTPLQLDILHALEPDQFALVHSVVEGSAQPLRLADTYCVPFGYFADDLYIRIFVLYLRDAVEPAAVDILIRILPHHVQRGIHLQFFTKNVGTLGTDILAIGYISMS